MVRKNFNSNTFWYKVFTAKLPNGHYTRFDWLIQNDFVIGMMPYFVCSHAMQNVGEIVTRWTKARNFAHSFLRVYLTTLGPVPKKISLPLLVMIENVKQSNLGLPGYQAQNWKSVSGYIIATKTWQNYIYSTKTCWETLTAYFWEFFKRIWIPTMHCRPGKFTVGLY